MNDPHLPPAPSGPLTPPAALAAQSRDDIPADVADLAGPVPGLVASVPLSRGPLLAVHAHPDDETLATGALLATWAASGQDVVLVTCTRGEQGEVIGDELAALEGDGPALAAHRETEIAAALEALGVQRHAFLDTLAPASSTVPDGTSPTATTPPATRFEDSGMAWLGDGGPGVSGQAGAAATLPPHAFVGASLDDGAGRLARLVRELRPAVVVTYEPGGGYGHPDHVRAHETTVRALELAQTPGDGLPGYVPAQVWWAVVPPGTLRTARARLADLAAADSALRAELATSPGVVLPDPEGPLPAVAEPARDVVATVAVRPVLAQVGAALAAHATQVHRIGVRAAAGGDADEADLVGWYALSNDVLVPWLAHEHYAAAVPDVHPRPAQQTSSEGR